MHGQDQEPGTALITGGAQRLGAAIARRLHGCGMNVAIHYNTSATQAAELCAALNAERPGSATHHQADLLDTAGLAALIERVAQDHGGLKALVNNASSFYPTALGETTIAQWTDLMSTNLSAPFFLSQAAVPWLRASGGCILNMVDVYGMRPRSGHPVYCAAKAGLIMLTESLALELAPAVRVNGIAPGPVLPPPGRPADAVDATPFATPAGRWGETAEIADAALFLIRDATFTTGAVLPVDGGRRISGY